MSEDLITNQKLTVNVVWNLIGTAFPILVALIAIPLLIEGMGLERFGVLTLAWMVVGYFSLFDLGLGRALTKLVAEKLREHGDEVPSAIWTALWLMVILGGLGAVILAAVTPWLVKDLLHIPFELQHEALLAFYFLAASIPVVIITTGLRGVLEAYQRFGLVNIVKVPLGIFTFLGPVAVLPFTNSLAAIVGVLVLARLLSLVAYSVLCHHVVPNISQSINIKKELIGPLTKSGSWMTVSNVIGPLLVYVDRLFIGAVATMAVVAYYSTPYEIVIKLLIIPGAFMGVMFPAFAIALDQNKPRALHLYNRVISYIYISLFPMVLIIVMFAHEGLTLWIGSDFADNSSLVLQLLAIGVFINSHAQVPFGMIQVAGRSDLTAKLHLLELPLYLLVLWWLLGEYGITGAAIAWVIRVSFDTSLLFYISQILLKVPTSSMYRLISMISVALFLFVVSALMSGILIKGVFLISVLVVFLFVAWFVIIESEERDAISGHVKNLIRHN